MTKLHNYIQEPLPYEHHNFHMLHDDGNEHTSNKGPLSNDNESTDNNFEPLKDLTEYNRSNNNSNDKDIPDLLELRR
jgi:hypothetical protein